MKFKKLLEITTSDGTGTDNFYFNRLFDKVMRRPNLKAGNTFFTDIDDKKKRNKKWRKKKNGR